MPGPKHGRTRPRRSPIQEYIHILLVSVILATFARTFLVQAFAIPSDSMEPELLAGDHILVNKVIYAPRRNKVEMAFLPQRQVRAGDVVVFRHPEDETRDLVKRCVGTAGDTIELIDKTLWRNGEPVRESFVRHRDPHTYPASRFLQPGLRNRDNFGPIEVPAGHLFCLGDNRDYSRDSRFWGLVREDRARGRAHLVVWSERLGGAGPDSTEDGPTASRQRMRWNRTLRLIQ